jgi:hypothetical protein
MERPEIITRTLRVASFGPRFEATIFRVRSMSAKTASKNDYKPLEEMYLELSNVLLILRYYFGICLEGLRKTRRFLLLHFPLKDSVLTRGQWLLNRKKELAIYLIKTVITTCDM